MNRFINGLSAVLIAVFALLPGLALAQNIDRTAAFNHADRTATLSAEGVSALERTARHEPGLRVMLDQTLGSGWSGRLEIVQKWTIQPGARFINSGLDRRGTPVQHPTTAKKAVRVYQIRSRTTRRTVVVKDDCLNIVQARVPAVPMLRQEALTTWDIQEVTVDIDVNVNVKNEVDSTSTATATASTAPINIVFNNVSQAAPLMAMGGGSPFVFVRDSRGLLSLGYQVGGGTRIYNNVSASAQGGAGGAGGNACVGPITNNNSNSNVNSNSNNTVVNTGSGSAAGSSSAAGSGSSKAGGGK